MDGWVVFFDFGYLGFVAVVIVFMGNHYSDHIAQTG
jgi:hypothetical protein